MIFAIHQKRTPTYTTTASRRNLDHLLQHVLQRAGLEASPLLQAGKPSDGPFTASPTHDLPSPPMDDDNPTRDLSRTVRVLFLAVLPAASAAPYRLCWAATLSPTMSSTLSAERHPSLWHGSTASQRAQSRVSSLVLVIHELMEILSLRLLLHQTTRDQARPGLNGKRCFRRNDHRLHDH